MSWIANVVDEQYRHVTSWTADPTCGEDFCDRCGDCLHCHGDDWCFESADHRHNWVVYADGVSEFRAGHPEAAMLTGRGTMTYTAEQGARILADVEQHPKRDLIEAIAEATFDLANEDGTGRGGGMWWHLDWAYALVEVLPELTLRTEPPGLSHEDCARGGGT